MSIEFVMLFNHLIFCHPLLHLPSVFPSIRVFSSEWALHIRWLKYWNFSISPSNEYSGLIYFRIDWFDLLAVQGTLKSLLQHHNLKASVLRHSAFFIIQLFTYICDCWKNHSFDYMGLCQEKWFLCFLHCLGLYSFPSKEQASLNFMAASLSIVILEPKKIKSITASTFSPSICHEVMELDAMILVFWMLSFKPAFSLSSFTSSRVSLVPLYFLPLLNNYLWNK